MNAHVTEQPALPFNPAVLRWARERREITVEDAAKRANVRPDVVRAWESETEGTLPTVRQARILADMYQRSFLEFFREQPPPVSEPTLVPDFRLHRGASKPRETVDLRDVQAWAEEMRLNLLDLYDLLGEEPPLPPVALHARMGEAADLAAGRARTALEFTIREQFQLPRQIERDALPKLLRHKMEAAAILVLRSSDLRKLGARGLCIASTPFPIVMFGVEAPSAQMFTLAHELAHVALGESAFSGSAADTRGAAHGTAVERWCNQFAGAFLVPAHTLSQIRQVPPRPAPRFDDASLDGLARQFGVSRHAMLLRLIDLGYVDADFYWGEKRAQLLAQEANYTGGGRADYYGSRYRSANGDLYTGLVLEAWGSQRITNHNAAEFMGIKNIKHLEDIRNNFASG